MPAVQRNLIHISIKIKYADYVKPEANTRTVTKSINVECNEAIKDCTALWKGANNNTKKGL
jgi:hypothetical protein